MSVTIPRSEFRSLLKQARREQEATFAGFSCHAEMMENQRRIRREALLSRQEAVREQNRAQERLSPV